MYSTSLYIVLALFYYPTLFQTNHIMGSIAPETQTRFSGGAGTVSAVQRGGERLLGE